MGPQATHAREVVLQLRELDLELAVGGVGVAGEDVEYHRGPVDHRKPERLLEVALLARGQLVVAGDQVRVGLGEHWPELLELPAPQVGVRVRAVAVLDGLADGGDAGGAQQLTQLGEVLVLRRDSDAECPLLRASGALVGPVVRLGAASVAAAVHSRQL